MSCFALNAKQQLYHRLTDEQGLETPGVKAVLAEVERQGYVRTEQMSEPVAETRAMKAVFGKAIG